MLRIPRFERSEINPRVASEEIGTLFQQFVWEILLAQLPDLLTFAGLGRDGGIDLSQTQDHLRTVVECKAIGEDGIQRPQQEWRKVAHHLRSNLQDPAGPPPGQPQYGPWYRRESPILKYFFCCSNKLGGQEKLDRLREEISGFFKQLAAEHAHLAHLRNLEVTVLDWTHFESRLQQDRPLAFRWFPHSLLAGFSLLDDFRPTSGFRSYLNGDRLTYYSRSAYLASRSGTDCAPVVREEDLLDALDKGDCTGVILTGIGGAGKTRMTLELGRMAQNRGWVAVRAKSRLQTADLDTLTQNGGDAPILFVLDYVETQRDFPDFVERLNDLRDELGCRIAYVANCRNSYYPSIETTPKHRCANVSSGPSAAAQDTYQREVVRHILRSTGLDAAPEHMAVCGDNPIIAVFLSFLHSEGRREELQSLLNEQDFGRWTNQRIRLSFPTRDASELTHDLALLMALFPMRQESYQHVYKTEVFGDLLRRLALDGWINPTGADEAGEPHWETLHDVFADRILVRFLESSPTSSGIFAKELFRIGREFGCLRSAFISVQRLSGRPEIEHIAWRPLLGAEIVDDTTGWQCARDLLLATPLLKPQDSISLLSLEDFWLGAEEEIEIQNRLGWLARWLLSEEGRFHAGLLRPILTPWLVRASQRAASTNFVLTRAVEFCPDQVDSDALAWINTKPTLFQTHYLLVAWLRVALDSQRIRGAVLAWISSQWSVSQASHVYKAWLDATQEAAPIREKLLAWVDRHGETPEAQFVYNAWLDATQDIPAIRDSLGQWLTLNHAHEEVDFVCRSWLEAGGDFEFVRSVAFAWLKEHRDEEHAVYLLKYIARQPELPAEVVLTVLHWCRHFPNNGDAVWRLAALKRHLFLEQVAKEFVAASEAVLEALFQQTTWESRTHQVTIQVLSFLIATKGIQISDLRPRVDTLFILALRHPQLFGAGTPAHPTIQRLKHFARFVDLIESGHLNQPGDDQAIARFLDWVNGWSPQRKNELRDLHQRLLNQFPERVRLWSQLKYDQQTSSERNPC